jgi:hypothetical protein
VSLFISSKRFHTCGRFICIVPIVLFTSPIIINSVLGNCSLNPPISSSRSLVKFGLHHFEDWGAL